MSDLIDDGLAFDEVGAWAVTKHNLVSFYAKLFSTGMKDQWGKRIYVELYSGSGLAKIRGTSKFIEGSPLNSLRGEHPFDKYIFCEEIPEKLKALKSRVKKIAPSANVAFVEGNCNEKVSEILSEIPKGTKSDTVLSLCFVDPFDIGIKFETLRALSIRYVDFLILLALYMDANRNYLNYVRSESNKIDEFLGSKTWRDRWKVEQQRPIAFPRFLASEFSKSMETLDYLNTPLHTMMEVRSDERNLPLYHLALFSRHTRAYKFWDQVLRYSTDQTTFWD